MAYATAKATTLLLLYLAALVCHAQRGDAKFCDLADIQVSQAKTGKLIEGQPEYQVTIANQCYFAQTEVMVLCLDLPWVEPVDTSLLLLVNERENACLVANGKAIAKGSPVTFTYASKTPQDFKVIGAMS